MANRARAVAYVQMLDGTGYTIDIQGKAESMTECQVIVRQDGTGNTFFGTGEGVIDSLRIAVRELERQPLFQREYADYMITAGDADFNLGGTVLARTDDEALDQAREQGLISVERMGYDNLSIPDEQDFREPSAFEKDVSVQAVNDLLSGL